MKDLLKPTTIAKIHQNSRVKVGLTIASTTQDIRIYKSFYNLSVYDIINFENHTLQTEYNGFYQSPKWLRKKLTELANNNCVPGLIVVKIPNGEITFNEYQYNFIVKKPVIPEIIMLDSYDHLNNLKDYKHQLSNIRNSVKKMTVEAIKQNSTVDDKNVYTLRQL